MILGLCACSGPRQPAHRPAAASVELPPGCDVTRVAGRVDGFLLDYSSGRALTLAEHFAPVHADRAAPHYYSRGFQWFADKGGIEPGGFVAYWPGRRLADYLERARKAGDEQRLSELYVNSYSSDQDWALFGLKVERTRPGLETGLSVGKGAVRCRDLRITLWDLGPPGSGDEHSELCDHDETSGDEAILCTR